jgi:hypothetical protein
VPTFKRGINADLNNINFERDVMRFRNETNMFKIENIT